MDRRDLQCPCCGGHAADFLSFGVVPRPHAMCPACRALERHRLLWLYFAARTNILSGEPLSVLHVAPEPVFQQALRQRPHLRYVSADVQAQDAMTRMDITSIPMRDGTFDVILCNHVLEHVPEDRQAMRELYRVLKNGGWALLQVPLDSSLATTREDPSVTDPAERQRLFGQRDHVRLYGRDYRSRLEDAGFDVRVDAFIESLDSATIARHALVAEDIYCCRKLSAA